MSPLFELDKVSKTYVEGGRRRVVLEALSTRFAAGEFVAIQGRSGSGKTTLLNLVAGLDTPDSGELRFDGRSIIDMNDRQRSLFRRRHLGFVFQFFNLVPTLTAAENIKLGLELNGVHGVAADDRAGALLDELGLGDRFGTYPDQLSGGEQQRVAIARAVAHRPRLILADEPSGNLDADTECEILDLLAELPRRHGAGLVVATHSAEVARRADRVLEIDHGALRPGRISQNHDSSA